MTRFDARRFSALGRARRLAWGSPFIYQSETGSTNDDALAAARGGMPSGTVFLAEQQAAGRGRRGKSWLGGAGESLLFSILVRPAGEAGSVSALTLAVGLGVRAALAEVSSEPLRIKWPNDVLAGARKLAGILCESHFDGKRLEAVVIGIGVNVSERDFPAELAGSAVSLQALSTDPASAPDRESLLVELLAQSEARVSAYLGGDRAALLAEFSEHDALRGERVDISGASPLSGTAHGIDAEGRLLIESDGLIVPVTSGTVRVAPR